jgi:hypothetical protein
MISGAWCLYEKRSNRWIFCRRKRLLNVPVVMTALLMLSITAWYL